MGPLRVSVASLASLGLLLAACGADGERPGLIVLPGMHESVPVEAYGTHPLTPGGHAMIVAPEGTIPVDFEPFPYDAGEEEAERAAGLTNSLDASEANLARGLQVFETFCQVCHGATGEGDGSIIDPFPNPPVFHAEHAMDLSDGQMFHILSRGQGIMPSYAAQVRRDDRWRVIHHVRQLQAPHRQAADSGGAP